MLMPLSRQRNGVCFPNGALLPCLQGRSAVTSPELLVFTLSLPSIRFRFDKRVTTDTVILRIK